MGFYIIGETCVTKFLARILGVDEDHGYQTLYAFFLVLFFVSWGIELVYSLAAKNQRPMELVADWTGASIGSAVVAIATLEVVRIVLADSILRRQRETIEATKKALEASVKERAAVEKERDELRARLQELESNNGTSDQS